MFLLLFFILIAGNSIHAEVKPDDYDATRASRQSTQSPTTPSSSTPSPTTPSSSIDFHPYSDATLNKLASTSPLFATIRSLKEELSVTKASLRKQAEHVYKIARQQFMLPPDVSKLVGTKVRRNINDGPLSSATPTGYWAWRSNPLNNQTITDTYWSNFLKGNLDKHIFYYSGPIVLPITPYFIGLFGLKAYTKNKLSVAIAFYNETYNQDLSSHLPFNFDMEIRIQNQGFTEIQKCSFKVTKLYSTFYSPYLIQINKNWSKNKFPKDIEILFL